MYTSSNIHMLYKNLISPQYLIMVTLYIFSLYKLLFFSLPPPPPQFSVGTQIVNRKRPLKPCWCCQQPQDWVALQSCSTLKEGIRTSNFGSNPKDNLLLSFPIPKKMLIKLIHVLVIITVSQISKVVQ